MFWSPIHPQQDELQNKLLRSPLVPLPGTSLGVPRTWARGTEGARQRGRQLTATYAPVHLLVATLREDKGTDRVVFNHISKYPDQYHINTWPTLKKDYFTSFFPMQSLQPGVCFAGTARLRLDPPHFKRRTATEGYGPSRLRMPRLSVTAQESQPRSSHRILASVVLTFSIFSCELAVSSVLWIPINTPKLYMQKHSRRNQV